MNISDLQENCSFTDILKTRNECLFVTAFVITREYGGNEEGGWWYNHLTPLETVVIQDVAGAINEIVESEIELPCFAYLSEKYSDEVYGDIYSVNGGQDLWVEMTKEPLPVFSRPVCR
jgi:hypothetical protein